MKVRIKNIHNEEGEINVDPNMSILELKRSIIKCFQLTISSDILHLMFSGKPLNDSKSLRDSQLAEGSMIIILSRDPKNSQKNQPQPRLTNPLRGSNLGSDTNVNKKNEGINQERDDGKEIKPLSPHHGKLLEELRNHPSFPAFVTAILSNSSPACADMLVRVLLHKNPQLLEVGPEHIYACLFDIPVEKLKGSDQFRKRLSEVSSFSSRQQPPMPVIRPPQWAGGGGGGRAPSAPFMFGGGGRGSVPRENNMIEDARPLTQRDEQNITHLVEMSGKPRGYVEMVYASSGRSVETAALQLIEQ